MSTIYITNKADCRLTHWLLSQGHTLRIIEPFEKMQSPINWHTDIFYCQLGSKIYAGNPSLLSPRYPGDVLYNGCSTGKYFIHNTKYTHPELLEAAKSTGHTIIHVAQGYSRCTVLPVDETSVITADEGCARACEAAGLEVLLITPGHILLPGFSYGFIGGCGGRIDDTVVFHGNLLAHPDADLMIEFIEGRGLKVKYFEEFPLMDIGSILVET